MRVANCYVIPAMDAHDARRGNLLTLIDRHGTIEALAEATGSSPGHLSQIKNREREMGSTVARRFEAKLELDHGWMDVQHHSAEESAPAAYGSPPRSTSPDLSLLDGPRRKQYQATAKRLTREQLDEIEAELREALDKVLNKMDGYRKSNEAVMKAFGTKKTTTVSAARAASKLPPAPRDGKPVTPRTKKDNPSGNLF